MTIAISAMVKPSRLLSSMVGGMCLCSAFSAAMIGFGYIGDLSLSARAAVAAGLILFAIAGLYRGVRGLKSCQLDISGIGQIRLTVFDDNMPTPPSNSAEQSGDSGRIVSLMPDSTLWPHLLLLRLQSDDGRIRSVTILPDCVAPGVLRALLVACRWIATHNKPLDRANF